MAEIIIYMDSECTESRQQINNLKKAGNSIECKDLSYARLSKQDLLPFMRNRSPVQIMNSRAEAVKKGQVDPVLLSFDEALTLMASSPDLIKGPLMQVDNLHIQGTTDGRVERYLKHN